MTVASKAVRTAKAALSALVLSGALFGDALAQQAVDSEVSVTRSESVQITNVDDWMIGVFDATATINTLQYRWDAQCAFSTSGGYRVEVTSANGGSTLALESGNGDQMTYEIYSFSRRAGRFELLRHTASNFVLAGRSASQTLNCTDESQNTNLWFTALVRPAPFNAAPPGIYRDVVTLLVSPE